MKPEEQRIAIAEACGWAEITFTGTSHQGIRPQSAKRYCNWNRPAPSPNVDDTREWHCLPDYLNDLNAAHEAEKKLSATQLKKYHGVLVADVIGWGAYGNEHITIHATAAQRAEAFLKTLSLWKDEN